MYAGVENLTQLQTLLAASNMLPDLAAVAPLRACTALQTLDLQNNKIEDEDGIVDFLKVLQLTAPFASSLTSMRGSRCFAIVPPVCLLIYMLNCQPAVITLYVGAF